MTAGSCQRARSASGSLYGSRTWKRPLERWSSVNTRPELAEAARRLRQLSHSQRAQLSMRGSQSVRSLRIGFSWARALLWWNARAASAAHRQLSIDGLARSLTARDRGFALGSSQPACSSPAATQRQAPAHPPTNGPQLGPQAASLAVPASAGPATSTHTGSVRPSQPAPPS